MADGTERRVYNLPADLLSRMRAFGVRRGMSSEADIVRQLLDEALQAHDTLAGILISLKARWEIDRDFRVSASALARHVLVEKIEIGQLELAFTLRNGERGSITQSGVIWPSSAEKPTRRGTRHTPSADEPTP